MSTTGAKTTMERTPRKHCRGLRIRCVPTRHRGGYALRPPTKEEGVNPG
jgi:hypothetical protein